MKFHGFLSQHRYEILLCAILSLSLFLNFWNPWNEGFSNDYYAAAVRSMLENPNLAFYNSFDAAGFVTVDKPPVGLWVQAISAAVFGFSGWSVALPQALAGVCSVGLLYLLVSRAFGKPAGLISATDLPDLVSTHTVRYFLAQGSTGTPGGGNTVTGAGRGTGAGAGGNSEIWAWVEENCITIPSSERGGSMASSENRYTLYDCAGSLKT